MVTSKARILTTDLHTLMSVRHGYWLQASLEASVRNRKDMDVQELN